MRKTIKFIFVFLVALILVGCKKNKKNDLNEVKEWMKAFEKETRVGELKLPNKYKDYDVAWLVDKQTNISVNENENETTIKAQTGKVGSFTLSGSVTVSKEEVSIEGLKVLIHENEVSGKTIIETVVQDITSKVQSYDALFELSKFGKMFNAEYQTESTLLDFKTLKVTQPIDDETVKVTCTISYKGQKFTKEKDIIFLGVNAMIKRHEAIEELKKEGGVFCDTYLVTNQLVYPTDFSKYNLKYRFTSFNEDLIEKDGKVNHRLIDIYARVGVEVISKDGTVLGNPEYFKLKIAKKNVETKKEKVDELLKLLAPKNIKSMSFEKAYSGISPTHNHLLFDIGSSPVFQEEFALPAGPGPGNRKPGRDLVKVEMITIHDTWKTGDGLSGREWARYLRFPEIYDKDREVSWHFVAAEDGLWRGAPINEEAWHAGDGGRMFKLLDTGIKYTKDDVDLDISTDGFWTIDGKKTLVKAPTDEKGNILGKTHIASNGILIDKGTNGNYVINNTYYNTTYGRIANCGGNKYSIGFESAVNSNTDYIMTLRQLAREVADLLIEHNLGINRVMQHNNFSGKPCPYALRMSGHWNDFLNMVLIEKYYRENLSDVELKFTSLTPELLDNMGRIKKEYNGNSTIGETVRYKVEYKINGVETTETFETKIIE